MDLLEMNIEEKKKNPPPLMTKDMIKEAIGFERKLIQKLIRAKK